MNDTMVSIFQVKKPAEAMRLFGSELKIELNDNDKCKTIDPMSDIVLALELGYKHNMIGITDNYVGAGTSNYGILMLIFDEESQLSSCSYLGRHPLAGNGDKIVTLDLDRKKLKGKKIQGYERLDINQFPFMGIPPRNNDLSARLLDSAILRYTYLRRFIHKPISTAGRVIGREQINRPIFR